MKRKTLAVTLLSAIVLAACSGENANVDNSAKEIETENVKQLVSDFSLRNITDQTASITSQQLIVTDSEEKESVYDLSGEDFFVSIAPYVNETHP